MVQIASADAEAYPKWAYKRLPTEAEFEFAARGGFSGKTFAWGDEFRRAWHLSLGTGIFRAN